MKAIKRTVAALLATLMLATSTSFTLAAENYTDDEAVVVAKVNAAGIMTGTDKGFEPSKSLTRAEAAAIIVRMKGISESAVKSMAGTTLFNDVAASHWASGYVNEASNLGIVKGVSAKEFAPDRDVTVAEFTTMAIRALGAGQLVDAEGTWPTNYVNFANEEGILDDVNALYTATASRLQAATIVVNTLEAVMWEKSAVKTNGEITWEKSKTKDTILEDILELTEVEFTLESISNNDKEVTISQALATTDAKYIAAGTYDVAERFDLTTLRVGLKYTAYVDDDEIQGMWIDNQDTIEFTSIASAFDDNEIDLKIDGKDRTYKVAAGATISINEGTATLISAISAKNSNAYGTAYLNNDNEITKIYATDYRVFSRVEEVTSKKVKMETMTGGTTSDIDYSCEDCEYFLTKDGKGISFADLKEDDVICYYTKSLTGSHKKYVGEVVESSVEGEVTSINAGKKTVVINKKSYDVTCAMPSIEDEIVAFTNHAGKIVAYYTVKESAEDAAIVVYARAIEDIYKDMNIEVKLLYTDGQKSDTLTFDLDDTYDELKDANLVVVQDAATTNIATTQYIDGEHPADAVTSGTFYKVAANKFFTTKEKAAFAYLTTVISPGAVMCYDVTGSKVTYKVISDEEDREFYSVDSTADLIFGTKSTYIDTVDVWNEVDSDSDSDFYDNATRVFVDEDTTFIKLKADDDYNVKFEMLDYDNLDTTDFAANSFILGYDDDDEYAKVVVFGVGTNVKRTSEANFAFISEIGSAKYDGETVDLVSVIYTDGTEATYYADRSDFTTGDAYTEGLLADVRINGEELTEVDDLNNGGDDTLAHVITSGYNKLTSYKSSKSQIMTNASATNKYTLSDDVLVLELKDNGNYAVRSTSDLVEWDNDSDENIYIVSMYTYTNDLSDNDTEVVAIVYVSANTQAKQLFAGLTSEDYDLKVINNVIYATQKTAAALAVGATQTIGGLTFTCVSAGTADPAVKAVLTYTVHK